MVFVVEVKPGLWYVYESYRKPGYDYPFKRYLGPADGYRGGLKMIERKRREMEEKAEQKKLADRTAN